MNRPVTLGCLWLVAACGVIKPLPADHFSPRAAAPPVPVPVAPQAPPAGGPPGEALPLGALRENLFAADDRQRVTSAEYPWSAVGKLSTRCTATLVGKRLVLTAAHCVWNPRGDWLADGYFFFPNLVAGHRRETVRATWVWYGSRTPLDRPEASADDWAILLLEQDLGTAYGWLGVQDYLAQPGDRVTAAGYSGDVDQGDTATTHVDCQIRGMWGGQVAHDCDMTRGASGGPIWSHAWGQPTIVAVISTESRPGEHSVQFADYDGTKPNGAVPATRFHAGLVWLLQYY